MEGKTIDNGKESQYELPDENREQSENRASKSHYESVDKHENNLNAVKGKMINNGKESQYELPDENREPSENHASNSHYELEGNYSESNNKTTASGYEIEEKYHYGIQEDKGLNPTQEKKIEHYAYGKAMQFLYFNESVNSLGLTENC